MTTRASIVVLVILVACPVASFAQANLAANGGFENGSASWAEWSSPGTWTTDVFAH